MARHKRAVMVGITTVFLVVFFDALLQNTLRQSPLVFLKLVEDRLGESDLLLLPSGSQDQSLDTLSQSSSSGGDDTTLGGTAATTLSFFLNHTYVAERLKNVSVVAGSSPRWLGLADVLSVDTINALGPNATDLAEKQRSMILVINTTLESEIGLGRQWLHRKLGLGECHVSAGLLRSLDMTPQSGQRVRLSFNLSTLAETFGLDPAALPNSIVNTNNTLQDTIQSILDAIRNANGTTTVLDAVRDALATPTATPQRRTATSAPTPSSSWSESRGLPSESPVFPLPLPLNISQNASLAIQTLSFDCVVIDSVENPHGKYYGDYGNVVILEADYLVSSFLVAYENLRNALQIAGEILGIPVDLPENPIPGVDLETFSIAEYSLMICVQYTHRMAAYMSPQDELHKHLIDFTNQVSEALGIDYPAVFQLPLASSLELSYFLRLFLDQLFGAALVLLLILGILLIFSLMLSDVEEKTYEYGMLRALGMPTDTLINILLTQGSAFAIPGICFGLVVAYLTNIPATVYIASYAYVQASFQFSQKAVLVPVLIGLFVPILSNIVPIRRALSTTLRDSLDVYHQTYNDTTVKIIRLEDLGMSLQQAVIALLLVMFGFMIYYLVPLSFVLGDLVIFFGILTTVLLGMLLGLIILSQSLQAKMEEIMLRLILWGDDRKLFVLISKNLNGHRKRNQKTSLMFTLSLAFVIFAGVMFGLQSDAIVDSLRLSTGADIVIYSFSQDAPVDAASLRPLLERLKTEKKISDFTFTTFPLAYHESVSGTTVSNLGGLTVNDVIVYGAESNYLSVTYSNFWIPTSVDSHLGNLSMPVTKHGIDDIPNILEKYPKFSVTPVPFDVRVDNISLAVDSRAHQPKLEDDSPYLLPYRDIATVYGDTMSAIVSEALRAPLAVDINSLLSVRIGLRGARTMAYIVKPRAIAKKMPGFWFSSYAFAAIGSNMIVSMEQYARLLKEIEFRAPKLEVDANSTETLYAPRAVDQAFERCMVRLPSEDSVARDDVIDSIRPFVQDDRIQIINTQRVVARTKQAVSLLLVLANIVAAIATLMCFFVLWLSFTANVRENSWELGVLRAIGLRFNQVLRAYLYEGACIVLSSFFLGTCVGVAVAVTLTLQLTVFTELPFSMSFPTGLFLSVAGMTTVAVVVGSYLPARVMKHKQIAHVLKGQ
eukprot:TRINITY_DN6304_c0_g1_i1.p1 TRINITY_DN6304_c0_g1~~TRINITY_DN6304_c0_g1_i1.p1  ORF type:complete len:1190 (-),score=307.13 TRINITY_DN6304_c0_g1_i1:20-3532(-)